MSTDRAADEGGRALVGRTEELAVIGSLLAGLPDRGGALLVEGEAGIGKTVLLAAARELAGDAVTTVWLGWVESEMVLPFAGVADLLRAYPEQLQELPDPQRRALRTALALEDGPPPNPLAACTGVLGVLTAAATDRPLLVLVDDLHWLDPSSRQVLTFVARRLESESVAMMMATRPGPGPVSGLATVRLGGLTVAECTAMVERRVAVPPAFAAVVARWGGNPLAVLESVAGRTASTLEARWSAIVDGLPDRSRRALFVVAAAREPRIGLVDRVLGELALTVANLIPAEDAGLVRAEDVSFRFRHPLVRSAVVDRTPLAVRRTVHQAFTGCVDGPERAWHQAAACSGPDDAIAAELAAAAEDARRRSGFATSAHAWCRAAELTSGAGQRAGRYLLAATDAYLGGESELALRCCDAALDDPGGAGVPDPGHVADVQLVRGRTLAWLGHLQLAHGGLVAAAEAVAPADGARAAALYAEAATVCAMDARPTAMLDAAQRSARLVVEAGGAEELYARAILASAHVLAGRTTRARADLAIAHRLAQAAGPHATVGAAALVLAQARMRLEQFDDARAALGAILGAARQVGVAPVLAVSAITRAECDYWTGAWAPAYADATEALQWAEEFGQIGVAAYSRTVLARLAALRGDLARTREHLDRVDAEAGAFGVGCLEVCGPAVEGVAALGKGDNEHAVEVLERVWRRAADTGLHCTNSVPFVPDLVEAHVHAGDRDRARELLSWLAARADESGLTYPTATAERLRGLLAADPDEAAAAFAAARTAHRRSRMPFELARTRLCEGETLRRARRLPAARAALADAAAVFRALGARPWVERAERELSAIGTRSVTRPGPRPALDVLTPQELHVARSVAAGMNNAEVAAALFLSAKTVEGHLTRVYRKLGARSRVELARRFEPADGL